MIRGENMKDHVSGCFGLFHPGTTSQIFRTTKDRDLFSSANSKKEMLWCSVDHQLVGWSGDIFLYARNNKIKKSKIKYDLKNQNLQTSNITLP